MRALAVLLLACVLAACTTISKVEGRRTVNDKLAVEVPSAWNRIDSPFDDEPYETWTQEGMPLDRAVIDAGAVRFRPMMLTAGAVIAGTAVMLFDPIFQGLAIALMAGEVASLALSRMTVPVVYFMVKRRQPALVTATPARSS